MMRKIIHWYWRRRLNLIFVASMVLAWAAITYLMPKEIRFRYEFQKGKPWLHEDLIAPYDFPIFKATRVYERERDSVERHFVPYFAANEKLEREKILELERNFDQLLATWRDSVGFMRHDSAFPNNRRRVGQMRLGLLQDLQFVFARGVVPILELDKLPEEYELVILRGNFAEESDNASVFTEATAYEYMKEAEVKHTQLTFQGDDAVLRFLGQLDLSRVIASNLVYDAHKTEQVLASRLETVSPTVGMVQKGQSIISRGEMVNDEKYRILSSLKREYTFETTTHNLYWVILGQSLLVAICLLVLYQFLASYKRQHLRKPKDLIMMLILLVGSVLVTRIIVWFGVLNVYMMPYVVIPILLKNFFDSRVALINHIINITLLGMMVPNGFEFLFLQLVAGFTAMFYLNNFYKRGSLTTTSGLVFLVYAFSYTAYSLLQEGDINTINYTTYLWFAGNSLLLLISYPGVYVFEKLFGYVSDLTLIELGNANNTLLRELAEKAPGTFQHSLQVANLGESAAFAIGANPLLIRTGAMYHDIGKMAMPQYFVENQISGFNPHDKISYERSAEIIISHVTKGVEIARRHNLPESIIDFIRTHHGTSKAQYFYRMYQQQFPDKEVNPDAFTYPGPKPFSRETAIMMMADAVEAASRTLREISEHSIRDLIDKIVAFQTREGQFDEADITFKEIFTIKAVFLRKLLNIYHARIEYPEEKPKA